MREINPQKLIKSVNRKPTPSPNDIHRNEARMPNSPPNCYINFLSMLNDSTSGQELDARQCQDHFAGKLEKFYPASVSKNICSTYAIQKTKSCSEYVPRHQKKIMNSMWGEKMRELMTDFLFHFLFSRVETN